MSRMSKPCVPASAKAASHVHSEWSNDASWPLTRIASTFARRGYHVVLMSEHSRGFTQAKWDEYIKACAEASSDQITLVPGIEYGDDDDVVHIPVWGQVPFFGEAPPIGQLLTEVAESGGTAVLAHPWRRAAWNRIEPAWYKNLAAIEVWNRKYDGIAPNHRSVELSSQESVPFFTSLDFHTRRQLFPLSLSIDLADKRTVADTIDPVSIYAALSSSKFRARAFGIPVERLTSGLPALSLGLLEQSRRAAVKLRKHL